MKNRSLTLRSALLFIFLFGIVQSIIAYDFEVAGIYYNKKDNNAEVTFASSNYNSYSGNVTIPQSVVSDGISYTVTAIGNNAFRNCDLLNNVSIPSSVTSIGSYAFDGCTVLDGIVIPDGVTKLDRYVFRNCKSLTSINIPAGVISINTNYPSFSGCDALRSLVWNAHSCSTRGGMPTSNIEQVSIGPDVTLLPDDFVKNSKITEVSIPESVTFIGSSAFQGCTGLTEVVIPSGVTSISNSLFSGCTNLTSVSVPSVVTTIGSSSFSGCTSLQTLAIPAVVTSIGSYAFDGCTVLDGIVIPEGVTKLDRYVFRNCKSLTSINIPSGVTSINTNYPSFSGCDALRSLVWNAHSCSTRGGMPTSNIEQVSIGPDVTLLPDDFVKNSKITEVSIPESVTSIGSSAFQGCTGLTEVVIPAGVTIISNSLFSSCTNLTSVSVPSSVTTIGSYAFSGCTSLQTLAIPSVVTSIGSYAFDGCTVLDGIVIPEGVTKLDRYVFRNCKSLTSINIPADVTSINTNYPSFSGCDALRSLVWNAHSCSTRGGMPTSNIEQVTIGPDVTLLPDDFVKNSKITEVTIPESVTSIGSSAFQGCTGLTEVVIPTGVTIISSSLFNGCTALVRVTIPSDVTSIGSSAFSNCSSLDGIVIPEGVTKINDNTFRYCSSLSAINIPSGVTSIGSNSFGSCSALRSLVWNARSCSSRGGMPTSNIEQISIGNEVTLIPDNFLDGSRITEVTIPESVTSIGKYAFRNCTSLIGVVIPSGVTSISNYLFNGCSSLISVTIPAGVTSIGTFAFCDCKALSMVDIPSGVTSIGNNAFQNCTILECIVIPEGVTKINDNTFNNCSGLTSINIPAGITSIGSNAFFGCDAIKSLVWNARSCSTRGSMPTSNIERVTIGSEVTLLPNNFVKGSKITEVCIPESVTSIGASAFQECKELIEVMIPKGVTEISNYLFDQCYALEKVSFSTGLTLIGDYSFRNCCTLTSVVIPNSVTRIGVRSFQLCKSLTDLTIGNSVTVIDGWAFEWCDSLTHVTIPNSVTVLGSGVFQYCPNLSNVTIGNSVTTIGSIAFNGCDAIKSLVWNARSCSTQGGMPTSNIETVTIGSEVTLIPEYFLDGSKITELIIPESVISIGKYAFHDCTGLSEVIIPNSVTSIGVCAFQGCIGVTDILISNSVTNIEDGAFNSCVNLSSVVIPNSVTRIGVRSFQLCKSLTDLTIGNSVTVIDGWAFEWCDSLTHVTIPNSVTELGVGVFQYCPNLSNVTIGNSVTTIGRIAFNGCPKLQSVTCLAYEPPTLSSNTFYGVSSDMVVYVPSFAVNAYLEAEYWKKFVILPIAEERGILKVCLPDGITLEDYANMRLELASVEGDRTMHYTVTDKAEYVFHGLTTSTTWNVILKNQYGDEFGRIDSVVVDNDGVSVAFVDLLKPHTIEISVITPSGTDVTAQSKVFWHDGDGELLKQDTSIAGLPTGKQMRYSVTLPQELAVTCIAPAMIEYTVKEVDNHITCQLINLAQLGISGKVKDANSNMPIYGANVTAVQSFGGGITKTTNATTDGDGTYSLELTNASTMLTVAASGYISQKLNCDSLMSGGDNIILPTVNLAPINGAVVNVKLTYTPAHVDGEEAETQNWYEDFANLDYSIRNLTANHEIANISVQYPQIVLMDEVTDDDALQVTVTSRKAAFKPVTGTAIVAEQRATVTLNIVEKGKLEATFKANSNPAVVGSLYDSNGRLVATDSYRNATLTIDGLEDGSYTLVTMGKSDLFNTVYDLNQLATTGLELGEDFVQNVVTVSTGIISQIIINEVPLLDVSKLQYTSGNTSFTVNKSSLVVGNYLTFRGQIDFKEQYKDKVSDVQLIVDLPEGCKFYEGSVLAGSSTAAYYMEDNRIIIPLVKYDDAIRFCATPLVSGNFMPSAFVAFNINGKTITQPIGNAYYTVNNLSISIPEKTAKTEIPISGTSLGVCSIDIYDNDVLIGHTVSLANGTWSTRCELYQPYNLSNHRIYGKVVTSTGMELLTDMKSCRYDMNTITVSSVTMINTAHPATSLNTCQYTTVFDFENGKTSPSSYQYWPLYPDFTFIVDFTDNNPDVISDVIVNVFTDHDNIRRLDAVYDSITNHWVANGRFNTNNLPVNVSVSYFANTECMLDAELTNDILSLNIVNRIQEEIETAISQADDFFERLLNLYLANEDEYDPEAIDELEKQLFELYGITPSNDLTTYSDGELIQLFDGFEMELARFDFDLDSLINADLFELYSNSEYSKGIELKHCDEYDESLMLDGGFIPIMLTDSTVLYFRYTETGFEMVSLINDLAVLFDTTAVNIDEFNSQIIRGIGDINDSENNSWLDIFWNAIGSLDNVFDVTDVVKEGVELDERLVNGIKEVGSRIRSGMPSSQLLEKLDGIKNIANKIFEKLSGIPFLGKYINKNRWDASTILVSASDIYSNWYQWNKDLERINKLLKSLPEKCEKDYENIIIIKEIAESLRSDVRKYYIFGIIHDVVSIATKLCSKQIGNFRLGPPLLFVFDACFLKLKFNVDSWYSTTYNETMNELRNRIKDLKCDDEEDEDVEEEEEEEEVPVPTLPSSTPIHDPSGFVYEGVPSNRLEGVTATCYYKETVEDMYGDTHEEVVLWDAEQYGQENPLLTDENGYYRWDVPIGMWQVKYEKVGYETTYSDWLPVPPPQLDVNIGMVQMRQPEVIKAHAYPKAVELEFDKFMIHETLTTDNITVSVNGTAVNGSIELLNAEKDDPLAITSIRRAPGTGLTFASRVRFNADQPFNADQVTLHVKQDVKSYADLQMNEDYEVTLPIEYEMEKIVADSTLIVPYCDSRTLTVTVMPAMASKGKTLNVRTTSSMILSTDAESYTLDNNGQAIVTVYGDLPGMGSLLFGIDGYDLSAATLVNVKMESEMTVATPTASIASGSEVEKGTEVYLYCKTEGATIYYTLDGSCPCDNTSVRKVYDGRPIIINANVTIKAMATAPDLYDSDVATFVYRVKSDLRGDVNNDGEVNIADVNALIDIILSGAVDEDTRSRADVNGDSEVNIADINALIDIILSPSNRMRIKVNCSDLLHMDDVTMRPGDVRTINVTLDDANSYSAMQCDIALPAGLTLVDISSVDGHISKADGLDESTMRAVNYSMDKRSFSGDGFPVMSLTVLADAALGTESEIKLTNVVLADAANKAWRAEDCTARVSNATGINDLTACVDRVWVEGNTLCIETRQDGVARIATINGVTYDLGVKAGVNCYDLDAGVYVVVINGRGHKIAVK